MPDKLCCLKYVELFGVVTLTGQKKKIAIVFSSILFWVTNPSPLTIDLYRIDGT